MQQDILYEAAVKYAKLRHVAYEIKLGRKGKEYNLLLHFPYDSFFHLAGIQHLDDLKFSSTNRERIFKDILSGDLKIEYLKKSLKYEQYKVEERIANLYLLEDIIENIEGKKKILLR